MSYKSSKNERTRAILDRDLQQHVYQEVGVMGKVFTNIFLPVHATVHITNSLDLILRPINNPISALRFSGVPCNGQEGWQEIPVGQFLSPFGKKCPTGTHLILVYSTA
jgi:hypothetical protein